MSGNEDAYWVDSRRGVLVVADGMGGGHEGERASAIVSEAFRSFFMQQRVPRSRRRLLEATLTKAHRDIQSYGDERGYGRYFDATVAALILDGRSCVCAKAGDSRVYRLSRGAAPWRTSDDRVSPKSNRVTRFVGHPYGPPEIGPVHPAVRGDTYVLCSDGLHDVVGDAEICRLACANASPEARAEALVARALELKTRDNVTVVVADVCEVMEQPVLGRGVSALLTQWSGLSRGVRFVVALVTLVLAVAVPWSLTGRVAITIHSESPTLVSIGGGEPALSPLEQGVFVALLAEDVTVAAWAADGPLLASGTLAVRRGCREIALGIIIPPTVGWVSAALVPDSAELFYRVAGERSWDPAGGAAEFHPGEYDFLIQAAGYVDSMLKAVDIVAGDEKTIDVSLIRERFCSLRILPPSGANEGGILRVVIDGEIWRDMNGCPVSLTPFGTCSGVRTRRSVLVELCGEDGAVFYHTSVWLPAQASEVEILPEDWMFGGGD